MDWISLPADLTSRGYAILMRSPKGAQHYGVFIALLQVVAELPQGIRDGSIVNDKGAELDLESISLKTRIPEGILAESIPVLLACGWLEDIPGNSGNICPTGQEMPVRAVSPRNKDTNTDTNNKDRNTNASHCDDGIPLDEFFEERYSAHPKKRDRVLGEQALIGFVELRTLAGQEDFRKKHDAWIATKQFQDGGGSFAPSFAAFVKDETWRYWPPEVVAQQKAAERTSDGTDAGGYFTDD